MKTGAIALRLRRGAIRRRVCQNEDVCAAVGRIVVPCPLTWHFAAQAAIRRQRIGVAAGAATVLSPTSMDLGPLSGHSGAKALKLRRGAVNGRRLLAACRLTQLPRLLSDIILYYCCPVKFCGPEDGLQPSFVAQHPITQHDAQQYNWATTCCPIGDDTLQKSDIVGIGRSVICTPQWRNERAIEEQRIERLNRALAARKTHGERRLQALAQWATT